MNKPSKFNTVEEYLSFFPAEIRKKLEDLRKTIKEAAPEAQEGISYNMPAYKYQGVLVYFAGYKSHIGFYPTASGIAAFKEELSEYPVSKGTVRFPLDQPLPFALIRSIVAFRLQENLYKARAKKAK